MSHDRDSETREERNARIHAAVAEEGAVRRAASAYIDAAILYEQKAIEFEQEYMRVHNRFAGASSRKRTALWRQNVRVFEWQMHEALNRLNGECHAVAKKRSGR